MTTKRYVECEIDPVDKRQVLVRHSATFSTAFMVEKSKTLSSILAEDKGLRERVAKWLCNYTNGEGAWEEFLGWYGSHSKNVLEFMKQADRLIELIGKGE